MMHDIETDCANVLAHFLINENKNKGRGIVITLSNESELLNVYVNIKHMRVNLKPNIPIEVFYANKIKPKMIKKLEAELQPIRFVNIHDVDIINTNFKKNTYCGFQIKPFAILASSFQDVLLLDANNTLLATPDCLFEYDEYKKYGAVFWSDYCYEFQCGQMVINKQLKLEEIVFICLMNCTKYGPYFYTKMSPHATFKFGFNYLNKLKKAKDKTYYQHDNQPDYLTTAWFKTNNIKLYGLKGLIQKNKYNEPVFLHHLLDEWRACSGKEKELYLRQGPNEYHPSELYQNYYLNSKKYYDAFKKLYFWNFTKISILTIYFNDIKYILRHYMQKCSHFTYYQYCSFFLRKPFEINTLEETNTNDKIDVVYKYVNMNANGYTELLREYGENKDDLNPERYRDLISVLKYSIKSVKKNFINLGKIYVVVSDKSHIELSDIDTSDVTVVLHQDIINKHYLPTFNSETITSHFMNINELSPEFLMMDDDFFIGKPVNATYFKQKNKYIHYVSKSKLVNHIHKSPSTGWEKMCHLTYKKCMEYFNHDPFLVEHAPLIMNNKLMVQLNNDYSTEISDTHKSRFRSERSLNYELFYANWIYHCNNSKITTEYCDFIEIASKYDVLNLVSKIDTLAFFNINDNLGSNPDLTIVFALEDLLDNHFKNLAY